MAKGKISKLNNAIKILTVILCVAVFILCLSFFENSLFSLNPSSADGEDFVKFIDVGQGDSILIRSNGYSALIDTGPVESSVQLSRALRESRVETVDVLMLSHLHLDHSGGVAQIFEDFNVENIILPELSTFSEGIYSAELAINEVTRSEGKVYKASEGMNFKLGDFNITVVDLYPNFANENNQSVIIKAEIDGKIFLFTGDAEKETENKLVAKNKDIDCDVLKVAHHGSNTSTTKDFLEKCSPDFGVISVGKDNIYNHPHRSTLEQLKNANVEIYRTDKQGDITFYINNGKFDIKTEK